MLTHATFRAIREQLGYSQDQLAIELDVSLRTIKRWESPAGTEIPAGVEQDLLKLKELQQSAVDTIVDQVKQVEQNIGSDAKTIQMTYYRNQLEYNALGRDKGSYTVANANSRLAGHELERLGYNVVYLYIDEGALISKDF